MNASLISALDTVGIPTNSIITAIPYLNADDTKCLNIYNELKILIPELKVLDSVNIVDRKYIFLYFVQEAIKQTRDGYIVKIPELLSSAEQLAAKYLTEWRYTIESRMSVPASEYEEHITKNAPVKDTTPKEQKPTKRSIAVQIYMNNPEQTCEEYVAEVVKQLDITDVSAKLYWYNIKKGSIILPQ
jgi:hypothetical protein